jgi:chromosome segregation ATPase
LCGDVIPFCFLFTKDVAMTTAKAGTKKKTVELVKKTEVVESVKNLSLGGVADSIAKTQVEVQKKLAEVSNQITGQLAVLENVTAAIALKQADLQTLHGIEASAMTLDEINGEIQATRESWEAEKADAEKAEIERQNELTKARTREQEEYTYRVAGERRKSADEFNAKLAADKKAEADRKELLEKGWAVREANLKAQETELVTLRAAVLAHPEELKKAVAAEVAVATSSLKKNLDNEAKLSAKDAETSLKIAQNEKAGLSAEVSRLNATIAELHKQVESAHAAAQSVATKALESAAGRQAMEALQNSLSRDAAGSGGASRRS